MTLKFDQQFGLDDWTNVSPWIYCVFLDINYVETAKTGTYSNSHLFKNVFQLVFQRFKSWIYNVNMHMDYPGGAQKGVKIKLIPMHISQFFF